MSSDSHQRKQELLDRIAVTRLETIDEANVVSYKVEKALVFSGRIGLTVKQHPVMAASALGAGGLGMYKIASMLISMIMPSRSSSKAGKEKHKKDSDQQGLFAFAVSSLWAMLLTTAGPVIRKRVQDAISDRLNRSGSK